jgi:hypothetical protein
MRKMLYICDFIIKNQKDRQTEEFKKKILYGIINFYMARYYRLSKKQKKMEKNEEERDFFGLSCIRLYRHAVVEFMKNIENINKMAEKVLFLFDYEFSSLNENNNLNDVLYKIILPEFKSINFTNHMVSDIITMCMLKPINCNNSYIIFHF